MTVDPYRELAKKNRQEIQKVHVEKLESNETDDHSRTKRREEEKPRRNPLLTILLVSFILIPILTGAWYSHEQSKKEPSNLEVIEKADQ